MGDEYCAQGLSLHLGKRQIIDNVSVALRGGEMTALIGPNGAGKSTLLRLLTGYLTPDSGTRHLAGKPLEAWSPEALSRRRAVMLQRTALQADWTVETVIAMGRSPWGATADPAVLAAVMAVTGCDGLAGRRYPGLSGGEQQRVQLARCLAQLWRDGAPQGWLFLDEPTSALTEGEVAHLFTIIRDLRAQGKAIIYISHRMAEVYELSDRVSVLRDGQYVGSLVRDKLNAPELVRMMVGRPLSDLFNKERDIPRGQPRLRVEDLTDGGKIKPSSLVVHAGEIVGLAGLVGSGRTEFAETLYGLRPPRAGRIWLENREISNDSTRARLASGLVYLPEDRQVSGLFLDAPVRWNTVMFNQPSLWQQNRREAAVVERYHRALGIKLADGDQPVRTLSGGNQQKVLLARCLEANPLLLIVDEPTRGVDVSARADIYQLLKSVAAQNVAVLMISSDLDEFIGLADRVLVMHQGRYSGELARQAVTVDRMMTLAFGGQA